MSRSVAGPPAAAALPRPPRWTKDPPPRTASSPAVEALVAALHRGTDPEAATAAFWSDVDDRGTPLVDLAPAGGRPGRADGRAPRAGGRPDATSSERVVTFLWRDRHGAGPGTRHVALIANKLTDPSLPGESALRRVDGTDVWWRAFRLSSAWRGTYVLAADDGDQSDVEAPGTGGRWGALGIRAGHDPRNPSTFPGPHGVGTLSLLELPDAPAQPFGVLPGGAPRGTVEEVSIPGLHDGDERRGWVHVPPGATTAADPHRLLILLDGADWLGRRDAPTILDALHHAGRIPPTITLLVDSGVGPVRTRDLATGDPFLVRLTETLPRWMRERYPVGVHREDLVLAGESMGGVAVLRAAGRSPELVGAVVAQSASLWWDGQAAADAPSPTVELLRERPPAGVRVHLHVGRDEWILLPSHRALDRVLADGGVEHALVEFEGGHDAVCWRGGLAEGLIAVLGDAPLGGAPAAPAPTVEDDSVAGRAS